MSSKLNLRKSQPTSSPRKSHPISSSSPRRAADEELCHEDISPSPTSPSSPNQQAERSLMPSKKVLLILVASSLILLVLFQLGHLSEHSSTATTVAFEVNVGSHSPKRPFVRPVPVPDPSDLRPYEPQSGHLADEPPPPKRSSPPQRQCHVSGGVLSGPELVSESEFNSERYLLMLPREGGEKQLLGLLQALAAGKTMERRVLVVAPMPGNEEIWREHHCWTEKWRKHMWDEYLTFQDTGHVPLEKVAGRIAAKGMKVECLVDPDEYTPEEPLYTRRFAEHYGLNITMKVVQDPKEHLKQVASSSATVLCTSMLPDGDPNIDAIAKTLKFSQEVEEKAQQYVVKTFDKRPFATVHMLRGRFIRSMCPDMKVCGRTLKQVAKQLNSSLDSLNKGISPTDTFLLTEETSAKQLDRATLLGWKRYLLDSDSDSDSDRGPDQVRTARSFRSLLEEEEGKEAQGPEGGPDASAGRSESEPESAQGSESEGESGLAKWKRLASRDGSKPMVEGAVVALAIGSRASVVVYDPHAVLSRAVMAVATQRGAAVAPLMTFEEAAVKVAAEAAKKAGSKVNGKRHR